MHVCIANSIHVQCVLVASQGVAQRLIEIISTYFLFFVQSTSVVRRTFHSKFDRPTVIRFQPLTPPFNEQWQMVVSQSFNYQKKKYLFIESNFKRSNKTGISTVGLNRSVFFFGALNLVPRVPINRGDYQSCENCSLLKMNKFYFPVRMGLDGK